MKTAEFPAVIEAKKLVARHMAFYKRMMEDEAAAAEQPRKKQMTGKKGVSTARQRSRKTEEACHV